jgi:hypothetical protein
MKKLGAILGMVILLLTLTIGVVSPVAAGGNGAFRATGEDPLYPQFDTFTVLVNQSGAQFWWTMNATISDSYLIEGHSYHEVWKWDVNNSSGEWAEMTLDQDSVSDRSPYNIPGYYGTIYYKTFDTTLGIQVAP